MIDVNCIIYFMRNDELVDRNIIFILQMIKEIFNRLILTSSSTVKSLNEQQGKCNVLARRRISLLYQSTWYSASFCFGLCFSVISFCKSVFVEVFSSFFSPNFGRHLFYSFSFYVSVIFVFYIYNSLWRKQIIWNMALRCFQW